MRAGSQKRTPLWLGGVAISGVISAHAVAYFIAFPHGHSRTVLLQSTGHRSWGVVVALALGALVVSLARFTLQAARRSLIPPLETRSLYVLTARRLILLQASGFVLLEALERLLLGTGPAQVLAEPVVLIGVALQILSALVAAGFLVFLGRALDRLCDRSPRSGFGTPPRLRSEGRTLPPRFLVATGGATLRGPPVRF